MTSNDKYILRKIIISYSNYSVFEKYHALVNKNRIMRYDRDKRKSSKSFISSTHSSL